ncbi:PREDICTED: probable sodium/potassium-transporting ATPase subunit beta-3 [Papilio polytes]|uniref:probable sodium/potassium-transporting ATPase subunit beta-3 n=1 Tax=Papilio polytes TaxID=76194 RepID=UPI0006760D74|nr:PREDICTED: probable sodium/potassium-transporting ATPase subunit beta-3 [Papilio polytes]
METRNKNKDKSKTRPLSKDRTVPSSSRDAGRVLVIKDEPESLIPWYRRLGTFLYDNEKRTVCERSRLSATPTGLSNTPLIWYKENDEKSYQKYIKAIDNLLSDNTRKRANKTELGPCGSPPYGYGEKPCIIIRVNKHVGWSVKPIHENSTYYKDVPANIKKLLENKQEKLYLTCDGFHSYDKEHIGKIEYYPNPPGIAADVFPLDMYGSSPLLAVQISEFTLGMSIAIECKMWYDGPTSSLHFLLYVTPKNVAV